MSKAKSKNRIIAEASENNGDGEPITVERITIQPPNYQRAHIHIRGTGPLVQCRFDEKAQFELEARHAEGERGRKGRARQPKDFHANFQRAQYLSPKGEHGHPASAFRNACIDACRLAGFTMTHAKMSIFFEADFHDKKDGTPLAAILSPAPPEERRDPVRNASGVADIRSRPMWRKWEMRLNALYNGNQFALIDVINLLAHAGIGVGIGEGRPFSKKSAGMGWGTFEIVPGETD